MRGEGSLFDDPVFESLLAGCRCHALTYTEFSRLRRPEGMDCDTAWHEANLVLMSLGKKLPFTPHPPTDIAPRVQVQSGRHWYFPTDRLLYCLGICLANGVNNPHVPTTLMLPEGRHLKLDNLASECYACFMASGWDISRERFDDMILGLGTPLGATEQLASNYYRLMLESLADYEGRCTPEFLEDVFARAVDGVELTRGSLDEEARIRRRPLLQQICTLTDRPIGQGDIGTALLRAITALEMFKLLEPFPVANIFMGRMVYSHILRRQGMVIISYVPVVSFFVGWKQGRLPVWSYHPRFDYQQAIQVFEGTWNWTAYIEELLCFIAEELGWLTNKLDGMALKRERLETIIAKDATHNARQKEVLIEALVHDDAEFSFESHMASAGVSYATAYTDLFELESQGFLVSHKKGKKIWFIAAPDLRTRLHVLLRESAPEIYDSYYDETGRLRQEIVEEREKAFERSVGSFSTDSETIDTYWPVFNPGSRKRLLKKRFIG